MAQVPSSSFTLHGVFDEMFEGVQILDFDFTYVYLNHAAVKHSRKTLDELIGRRMTDVFRGIDETAMYKLIERCMWDRTAQHLINEFTYPDGAKGWFDLRISPVSMGVLILSVDITDERIREENLRRSKEDLAIMLESMADGVITADTNQCVTRMNPAAEQLTGWTEEEACGKPLDELVQFLNQRTGEVVHHAVQKVLMSGIKIGLANDTFLVARDGTRIPIASSGAPLRHEQGEIRGVVFVIRNMKEEYELSAMLNQAQKMEAIGRLAGGIAHDFNNLLTVIVGYCNMVLEDTAEDAVIRPDLEEIRRAGEQARQLTRQLLAFSRKEQLSTEVLDPGVIVRDMLSMLKRIVGVDYNLELEVDPDLPAVEFDTGHIQQIVMNLVINARDALQPGGTIRIKLERAPSDEVALIVEDDGSGMDLATQARIFEPFFTTKPVGQGTGLGLSTVYGIVQQGGGDVRVESQPNEGTRFTILLPRA